MSIPDETITLIFSKKNEKTISELIIMLLTSEWPLSAKGMLDRIRARHMSDVSPQGVHKAIKKLHAARILERNGRHYRISPEWLERLYKFSTEISSAYEENEARLKGLL